MVIEPGRDWGVMASVDGDAPAAATDRALAELVEEFGLLDMADDTDRPPIRLTGGDLFRTLGGRPDAVIGRPPTGGVMRCLPIDVGSVRLHGERHVFVAHAVFRRRSWLGRIVAVMNAEWIGQHDVAPVGHPNDGRLDLVDARLRPGQLLRARRRLATGTHVPHPDIVTRRVRRLDLDVDPPLECWLDGQRLARVDTCEVICHRDAALIVAPS